MGPLRPKKENPRMPLGHATPCHDPIIRVRGLGYPERLISSLGAGACGVVSVGMFLVSVVSVVSVSVSVPGGWVAAGRLHKICFCVAFKVKTHFFQKIVLHIRLKLTFSKS